jgi:hypothetical protein
MPPRRYSRYTFSEGILDQDGDLTLTEPVPFAYQDLSDNVTHVVQDGDTLFGLAGLYFDGLPRAAGLWWVIADFQPVPIDDPTIALTPGSTLFIPSLRTVQEQVFDERRRNEEE